MSQQLRNPKPETRARVLEAAADLIRREGVLQLRVEEIAEHAGVSVGTFYLYFEGKDDLCVHLVVEYTERLRERLAAAYAGGGTFAERMQRPLDAYLDFVEVNEAGFLYFRDSGTVDTTVGRLSTWAIDQHARTSAPPSCCSRPPSASAAASADGNQPRARDDQRACTQRSHHRPHLGAS